MSKVFMKINNSTILIAERQSLYCVSNGGSSVTAKGRRHPSTAVLRVPALSEKREAVTISGSPIKLDANYIQAEKFTS